MAGVSPPDTGSASPRAWAARVSGDSGGGGAERRRDIQFGDVPEAGGAQQPMVVAVHGDGSGTGGARPPPRRGWQARRFEDRGKADAPAGLAADELLMGC